MIFFNNLQKENNIVHGILERKDGSVNPFSNVESEKNILKALKKLNQSNYSQENIIYSEQIHESKIHITTSDLAGYIKLGVDGLISQTPGQILVVKTADCIPILLYDRKNKIIGTLHGGRKSLEAQIIPKAISLLKLKFQSSTSNILVGLGPHIKKCHYWLKKDTLKNLEKTKFKKYFIEKENKTYFDLTKLATDQLLSSGIAKENIEDSNICTYDEAERFFSARKREDSPHIYNKEKERFPCFGSFIILKNK